MHILYIIIALHFYLIIKNCLTWQKICTVRSYYKHDISKNYKISLHENTIQNDLVKKKLFSNIIMKKYNDKKFYSNYTH